LILGRGDWLGALTSSPIVIFFLVATVLSLLLPLFKKRQAA